MYRADLSIDILKYLGIWSSTFLPKGIQLMYNVFSIVMILVIYNVTISTILYLFLEKPSLDEFTESLFYVLALSTACVKLTITLLKRDKIVKLGNMLLDKNCYPQDKIECIIQSKFDHAGRKVTIVFFIMASTAVVLSACAPLLKGSNVTLPFRSWIPYNLENRKIFWLTYTLHAVGAIAAAEIIIAVDSFIMVMMIQLCAQLEILMHRIKKYPHFCFEDKNIYASKQKIKNKHSNEMKLGVWIDHHESMYRFGRNLNSLYNFVFLFQLCATTIDVCTSTYLLSTVEISTTKFWRMAIALSALMFQISIYSWPGNMVMEKSKEIGYAIYSMDWSLLPINSRTSIFYIMKRSEIPIKFTTGKIFPLTIETFTSILRLSFSIFNLLLHSS